MRNTITRTLAIAGTLTAVLGGSAYALAASGTLHLATTSGSIKACVNSRTRVLTQPSAGKACPSGSFGESWNKQGPSGVVATSVTTLQDPSLAPATIQTGGSFNANSVQVGTVKLAAGTYLVTLNAKATPNDTSLTAGAEVFPQFFVYDQAKNPSFAGDLFNVGDGPLEPTATNHDSYYSGTAQIVVPAGGETLYVYGFGYDSDSGAGTYALDSLTVTATQLQTSS